MEFIFIRFYLLILVSLITKAWSDTVCSDRYHTGDLNQCLAEITTGARDHDKFWFGTDYSIRCPDPHGSLECSNPMPSHHDSLVSRLFGDSGHFHSASLDRYIDVHFHSQKGQYNSCGYIWESGDDMSFSVDPLGMESFTPWETRNMPNISWIAPSSEEHYTLIVLDVGYLMAHGIYMNIPGNYLPDGEAIMEYHGPEHIFSFHNIYTFFLFKQNGSISLSHEWEAKLKHKYIRNIYTIPDLMEAYGLMGPVGMTWMRIKGDPYAIQLHITQGEYYACPYLMEAEINKHNRSFIPHHTRMTVDVEVTFSPPAIAFTSCCSAFYYDHRVVKLNPLGNSSVRCGDVRTGVEPSVVLTRLGLMKESKMFNSSLYTLLCVDPDVPTPSFGTPDFPLLHWLISNIQDGDLTTGHVVMTYAGPAPLNNLGHTYYFLLYEQTMELNVSDFINYTNPIGARSLFNISGFVEQKHLTLVGATYMVARSDEYARYDYVELRGRDPENYCLGIEGFADPCPRSNTIKLCQYSYVLNVFLIFVMLVKLQCL